MAKELDLQKEEISRGGKLDDKIIAGGAGAGDKVLKGAEEGQGA